MKRLLIILPILFCKLSSCQSPIKNSKQQAVINAKPVEVPALFNDERVEPRSRIVPHQVGEVVHDAYIDVLYFRWNGISLLSYD